MMEMLERLVTAFERIATALENASDVYDPAEIELREAELAADAKKNPPPTPVEPEPEKKARRGRPKKEDQAPPVDAAPADPDFDAPAAPETPKTVMTKEEVMAALKATANVIGMDETKALLKTVSGGKEKMAEVDPTLYGAIVDACDAAIKAKKGEDF